VTPPLQSVFSTTGHRWATLRLTTGELHDGPWWLTRPMSDAHAWFVTNGSMLLPLTAVLWLDGPSEREERPE